MRRCDIPLLPSLCAASKQHDRVVAMSSKVDAIARPEIDPVFQESSTQRFTFDKLPNSIRVSATVTLAAAVESSSSNQPANGLRPVASRYSTISTRK